MTAARLIAPRPCTLPRRDPARDEDMSDWTTDAANAIDNAVGLVRERTVEPVQAVVRARHLRPARRADRSFPAVTLHDHRRVPRSSRSPPRATSGSPWCGARRNLRDRRVVLLDQAQSLSGRNHLNPAHDADEAQWTRGKSSSSDRARPVSPRRSTPRAQTCTRS